MFQLTLVFLILIAVLFLLILLARADRAGEDGAGHQRRRRWGRRRTALDPVGPLGELARARRLAAAGHALLATAPDATIDGQPVRPLIAEHLPALVRHHEAAVRLGGASALPEAEAALKSGLDRIDAVLDRARATLSADQLDQLRAQVRFLESRHPDEWPALESDARG